MNKEKIQKILYWAVPTQYLLILLLFFMPFCMLSCNSPDDYKTSGYEITGFSLVVGTEIELKESETRWEGFAPKSYEKTNAERIEPNILSIGAFSCTVICLLIGFINWPPMRFMSGVLSLGSFIALLIWKTKFRNGVIIETDGFIAVDFLFSFWAVVWLFLGSSILSIYMGVTKTKEVIKKERSLAPEDLKEESEQPAEKAKEKEINPDDYLPKY